MRWSKSVALSFVVVALASAPRAASATPVLWQLEGVLFDDLASASGHFVYDADTNVYSGWSISVQAGRLPAFTYHSANSQPNLASNADADGVMLVAIPATRYLNLNFSGPLTNAGGRVDLDLTPFISGFDVASWECDNCDVLRFAIEGTVTAQASVPEPGTLALLGLGLLGARLSLRRGRRASPGE